ncbi:hypothetical protein HPB52_010657 [Rhipicephalus sanguineus]|uniref:Uncharacterized protein n=1 Tax=Rhipicephalus sanguineus TaxID=34632 RepID=A0A9D4Q625_RHISA|nr:hypothetical protein HPB52_010657 [Rhipicephalus sanguineus]
MDSHDHELSLTTGLQSKTPSPPPRLLTRSVATPQAAPRWLNQTAPLETASIDDAGEQPSATSRDRPRHAEPGAVGRRGSSPLPGQRTRSAAASGQSKASPGLMQAAMRDSTFVAVEAMSRASRRQSRTGPPVPVRAKLPYKGVPKKELDIVIELPKNIVRPVRHLGRTKGTVQDASMSNLPPLPAARMPQAATETTMTVGELSCATNAAAGGVSAIQLSGESSALRSISTTVGTIVSRLFTRGPGRHQATSMSTLETASTTRGRNPREIYVDIALRPPPESTASVGPITAPTALRDSDGALLNTGEITSGAPKVCSLKHVVTLKSPRKRPWKGMKGEERGNMKRPPEWVAAERLMEAPWGSPFWQQQPAEYTATRGPDSHESVAAPKASTKKEPRKDTPAARRRSSTSQVSSTMLPLEEDAFRGTKERVARRASCFADKERKKQPKPAMGAEKHDDVYFDKLPVKDARKYSVTLPQKSSLKRKQSADRIGEVVDEYTKRHLKADRDFRKEVVSPTSPPEGAGEVAVEKDKKDAKEEALRRESVAPASLVSPISLTPTETVKEVPTKKAKKKGKERRSSTMKTSALSSSATEEISTKETTKARKGKKTSIKQSAASAFLPEGAGKVTAEKKKNDKEEALRRESVAPPSPVSPASPTSPEATKEVPTKEAKKTEKGKKPSMMKTSALSSSATEEVSTKETKTRKGKKKTSKKQNAAPTSLEAAKEASGQTEEDKDRRDMVSGNLSRTDARPVDTAEKHTISEGQLHEEGAKHEMPTGKERSPEEKPTDAAMKEKVAQVISGDQREITQIALTSDLPQEGKRKDNKKPTEVSATSKNVELEKLAETGVSQLEGHVKASKNGKKAKPTHYTTEGDKTMEHLEEGKTDGPHSPQKSSLANDAEDVQGREKIPKKGGLKKTKGQTAEGGKAIEDLAEGTALASEGVLQSCMKKADIAAALTPQGAEVDNDHYEEEEAKASRWEMMRRKDSMAVHRIVQKKHKGRGPVAEGGPAVLQLGNRVRLPVQKAEVEQPTDAGHALEAGRVPDTGLSPISSGRPRQKGRRKVRDRGPGGVPGVMPMGPMPPMGMMDMRGRMPRRRRRWRGRERKGPYAVGDSASKGIDPDKIKFSRIKMSPEVPQAEVPLVRHSPIFDAGSPTSSPKGGSPASSMISHATPEIKREKEKSQPRDGPAVVPPNQGDAPGMSSGDLSPIADKVAPKTSGTLSPKRKRSRKKRKGVLKTPRTHLKGKGGAMTVQELLKEIKQRKLAQGTDAEKGPKAGKSEHKSSGKKKIKAKKKARERVKKKKVEKKTADTQTSFLFTEPETPAVMLESGDRGFCDFRFTVGLNRVVRGALSHNESIGQQAQRESPHAATRATNVDDELELLDSGTEAQLTVASAKPDASSRHKATLPAHLTESVYLRNEIGGDEPRDEGKKGESAVSQQKVPHPLPPPDSTTFTVDSVLPESPLKEASTAAEASPVAHMAVSLTDFLTKTAHETRSLEERVKTESPTEVSTVAETTTLSSEILTATAAESTSPEKAVSPASMGNMNRNKEKSPGGSPRSSRPEATRGESVHYCDTAFCSQEARYVESLVTSNQRPCVSFYEHVCDKWLSQQPKRPTGSEPPLSRDSILQSSLARQLLSLVQDSIEPDLQTAAKLYSSCAVGRPSNLTSEDKTALEIMFESWVIRSWPRTDHKNLSNLSVWRFAAELARDLDLATLFMVTVGVDPNDVGATILELSSPRSLFSDSDSAFEHEAKVYRTAVHEIIASLNATTSIDVDDFTNRLVKVSGVLRSATLQSEAEEDFAVLTLRDLDQGVRHFTETLLANVVDSVQSTSMKVTAKSPKYVRADLPNALLSVPPLDALNYMGFLVLVRVAPFLPEHLQALRTLFGKSVVGHTVADVTDTARLCLWLVDHSLPGCFSKASHKWLQQEGHQDGLKQWLNHLEFVFLAHVPDFAWMSNLSALLVRYRFKRRPVTHFGGGSLQDEDSCAPEVPSNATVDHPLRFYLDVSTHRPERKLRGLLSNSTVLRRQGRVDAASELRTEVTFDHALHRVHVPAALFNLSVPTNSSFFVFQLARVAVRFYRGLVQALYENPFEREVPLRFTDESRRRLSDLASCFVDDAQRSPPDVRGLWSPPRSQRRWSSVGKPLLDQVSALLLALRAFDEFLHVRRIWKADDRLADLPATMAQKLFFVYLALDNCEPTRTVEGGGIPALLRVNLPLRHVPQFAEAFNCSPADHMALSPGMWCNVFRSGAVQLVRTAERRRRGTTAMTHFGPLDGPYDGRPVV